ncbi:MerR family transcriptional regulator [Thalassovita mangrovi]|nr:MerR family transcriptional regulator [Thalassovita mangrovi]
MKRFISAIKQKGTKRTGEGVMKLRSGWSVEFQTFGAKEVLEITRLPQALLRLWRQRGYFPEKEKGRWAKYDANEIASIYLLYAFSKLGMAPSHAAHFAGDLAPDLLFFATLSVDGACEFLGPPSEVDVMRREFDDSFDLARSVIEPKDERRYVVSVHGSAFERIGDLNDMINSEASEYFSCIDLVAAGRGIAIRAQRPLVTFRFSTDQAEAPKARRLSHGQT